MDLSAFWGITIIKFFIYGVIWGQHVIGENGRTLRTVFLCISIPVSSLFLFILFNMSQQDVRFPLFIHSIAVLGPVLLFLYLFNRLIDEDKMFLDRDIIRKAEFESLSPLDKKKIRDEQEIERKKTAEKQAIWSYGAIVPALVCPHCQTKGQVRRTEKTRIDKTRVNSVVGNAVGLGTNTRRDVLQMYCGSCGTKWDV
jgi:hypothetical protein